MPETTPAGPEPTTYRHSREDVLVALSRVEELLRFCQGIPGEEALPVRIGPPLPADAPGKATADAWNLRVLVEELRAHLEEAADRAAHRSTVTVTVRPELDPEATGDVAAELGRIVDEAVARATIGTGPGPTGITVDQDYDRESALGHAVKFLAGTSSAENVVSVAAKFAAFLTTGQTDRPIDDLDALGRAVAHVDAEGWSGAALDHLEATLRTILERAATKENPDA